MSRSSTIALGVLIGLIALFLAAKHRHAGHATVSLPAETCDAGLWKHVNEKDRLKVVEECTAVEGRVVSLHRAPDGDLHIAVDPESKSVLNFINLVHARGNLVVEVICEHTPSDADDQVACGDFHPQTTIPSVGDRIRVTGAYVTDRDNGWNEVHPVSSVEILH